LACFEIVLEEFDGEGVDSHACCRFRLLSCSVDVLATSTEKAKKQKKQIFDIFTHYKSQQMADRREARRAKILARGEERLKRITQSYGTSLDNQETLPSVSALPSIPVSEDTDVQNAPSLTSATPEPPTKPPVSVEQRPASPSKPTDKPAQAPKPTTPSFSSTTTTATAATTSEGVRRRGAPTTSATQPNIDQDELMRLISTGFPSENLMGDRFLPAGAIPDHIARTVPSQKLPAQQEQQQAPSPKSTISLVLAVLRALFIAVVALFSIVTLISSFDIEDTLFVANDQGEEELDLDLPTWAAFAFKLKKLTSGPMQATQGFSVLGMELVCCFKLLWYLN
jgi:hypothetical protein